MNATRLRALIHAICARLARDECTCTDDEVTCERHYHGW